MTPSRLLARDARSCWHPYTQHATAPEPLPVARAEGAWLTLTDGHDRQGDAWQPAERHSPGGNGHE